MTHSMYCKCPICTAPIEPEPSKTVEPSITPGIELTLRGYSIGDTVYYNVGKDVKEGKVWGVDIRVWGEGCKETNVRIHLEEPNIIVMMHAEKVFTTKGLAIANQ